MTRFEAAVLVALPLMAISRHQDGFYDKIREHLLIPHVSSEKAVAISLARM